MEVPIDDRYLVSKDRFVPSSKLLESYQQMYKPSMNKIEEIVKEPLNAKPPLFQTTYTSFDANKINLERKPNSMYNFVEER